jgi:hypothetical protein
LRELAAVLVEDDDVEPEDEEVPDVGLEVEVDPDVADPVVVCGTDVALGSAPRREA